MILFRRIIFTRRRLYHTAWMKGNPWTLILFLPKKISANSKLKKCQTSEIFSVLLVPYNLKIQSNDDGVKFKNKNVKTI